MTILSFPAFQSKTTSHVGGMRNFQNCSETKDIKKILTNIASTMEPFIITSAWYYDSYSFKEELGWWFSQSDWLNSFGNFKVWILNILMVSSILEIFSKVHLDFAMQKFLNCRLWISKAVYHVQICLENSLDTWHWFILWILAKQSKAYGEKDETNIKSKHCD